MNRASVIIESLWYFLGGAIALFVAVQYGIPFLEFTVARFVRFIPANGETQAGRVLAVLGMAALLLLQYRWRGVNVERISASPTKCNTRSVRLDSQRFLVGDLSRRNWVAHRHPPFADRVYRPLRCAEATEYLAWHHYPRSL